MGYETQQKPLIERLSFTASQPELYLDGKLIFTTPKTHFTTDGINVIGVDETRGIIDIGTGQCCHGYFYRLQWSKENSQFNLELIRHIDLNVYDLLHAKPAKITTDVPTKQAVLATGYGCAGEGVRLIGLYDPIVTDILPDFHGLWDRNEWGRISPRFRVSEGRIYLDIHGIDRMFSSARNPNKPAELHDASDKTYTAGVSNSFDLTERLANAGVDINQTLEFAKDYKKLIKT